MEHDAKRPLIVYGHDWCSLAAVLRRELNEHDVPHEWRDVLKGEPHFKEELRALARGNLAVPTVILPDGSVMVEPRPETVLERLGLRQPSLVERLLERVRER